MHTLNFKQENIPHLSFIFFIRYHVHIFPVGKKKLFYVTCYSVNLFNFKYFEMH